MHLGLLPETFGASVNTDSGAQFQPSLPFQNPQIQQSGSPHLSCFHQYSMNFFFIPSPTKDLTPFSPDNSITFLVTSGNKAELGLAWLIMMPHTQCTRYRTWHFTLIVHPLACPGGRDMSPSRGGHIDSSKRQESLVFKPEPENINSVLYPPSSTTPDWFPPKIRKNRVEKILVD